MIKDTENEPENAELRKIKERKRLSDKKYYENKKRKETEYESKNEPENKIKNNIIEQPCIKENINPLEEDSSDWSGWLYDTGKGSLLMMVQTLIQSLTTIAVPAIIMWMIPRPGTNSITMPSTSTSAQQSRQREEHTDQQQTVSSLSQLM